MKLCKDAIQTEYGNRLLDKIMPGANRVPWEEGLTPDFIKYSIRDVARQMAWQGFDLDNLFPLTLKCQLNRGSVEFYITETTIEMNHVRA